MQKQHLLRLQLPHGCRLFPDELRGMLAKTNQLPAEFFARDKETGQPIRERPHKTKPSVEQERNPDAIPGIRMIGGTTWVGILADDYHKPLLDQAVVPTIQVVSQRCQVPVPVEMMTFNQDIAQQSSPSEYFVREMVIRQGAERGLSDVALREVVGRRILEALLRQTRSHGLDCPTNESLGLHVEEVIRPRGLRLVTSSGATPRYLGLMDVKFFLFAKLTGFWFAGNLTSRGYGRIVLNDFRKGEKSA